MKVSREAQVEFAELKPGKHILHIRVAGRVSEVHRGDTREQCIESMKSAGWKVVEE